MTHSVRAPRFSRWIVPLVVLQACGPRHLRGLKDPFLIASSWVDIDGDGYGAEATLFLLHGRDPVWEDPPCRGLDGEQLDVTLDGEAMEVDAGGLGHGWFIFPGCGWPNFWLFDDAFGVDPPAEMEFRMSDGTAVLRGSIVGLFDSVDEMTVRLEEETGS